jgi:hypothetical protein
MAPRGWFSLARWAPAALLAVAPLVPASVSAELPSYARPVTTITGTIDDLPATYRLMLRDDRGYLDDVTLRKGTVIAPTGTRLRVGMRVKIHGHADGKTFDADEIDVSGNDSAYTSESPSLPYGDSSAPYTYSAPSYSTPYSWSMPYGTYGYWGPAYGWGWYYPYYPYASGPVIIVVPGGAAQPLPGPSPGGPPRRRPLSPSQPYVVRPYVPAPHAAPAPAAPPAAAQPPPVRGPGDRETMRHGGRR